MTSVFVDRRDISRAQSLVLSPSFQYLKWVLVGNDPLLSDSEKKLFGEVEVVSSWDVVVSRITFGLCSSVAFIVSDSKIRERLDDMIGSGHTVSVAFEQQTTLMPPFSALSARIDACSRDDEIIAMYDDLKTFGFHSLSTSPFVPGLVSSLEGVEVVAFTSHCRIMKLEFFGFGRNRVDDLDKKFTAEVEAKRSLLMAIKTKFGLFVEQSGVPMEATPSGIVTNACVFSDNVLPVHIQIPFVDFDTFFTKGFFFTSKFSSHIQLPVKIKHSSPHLCDGKEIRSILQREKRHVISTSDLPPLIIREGQLHFKPEIMHRILILWDSLQAPWWANLLDNHVLRITSADLIAISDLLGAGSKAVARKV